MSVHESTLDLEEPMTAADDLPFADGAYANLFWRAYLGSPAFALWQVLATIQGQLQEEWGGHWPSISRIVEVLGHGSRHSVLGREATTSRPKQVGMLQTLVEENIVLSVVYGDGRDNRYTFSVHESLPILTPTQVSSREWSPDMRFLHGRHLAQLGVDVADWRRITAVTLVEPLGAI